MRFKFYLINELPFIVLNLFNLQNTEKGSIEGIFQIDFSLKIFLTRPVCCRENDIIRNFRGKISRKERSDDDRHENI